MSKKKDSDSDEPLVAVPIPALIALLLHHERDKGEPLTQQEVESIRDSAVCMTMPRSVAEKMAQQRGYDDINPEHCWEEWQAVRDSLLEDDGAE